MKRRKAAKMRTPGRSPRPLANGTEARPTSAPPAHAAATPKMPQAPSHKPNAKFTTASLQFSVSSIAPGASKKPESQQDVPAKPVSEPLPPEPGVEVPLSVKKNTRIPSSRQGRPHKGKILRTPPFFLIYTKPSSRKTGAGFEVCYTFRTADSN